MTEALDVPPEHRVLEIGTGSGYQAAVLAELARDVYSMEIVEPLANTARATLTDLGYRNVHTRTGNGYAGWPEHAPFDRIIVTAAPPAVPSALIEQGTSESRKTRAYGPASARTDAAAAALSGCGREALASGAGVVVGLHATDVSTKSIGQNVLTTDLHLWAAEARVVPKCENERRHHSALIKISPPKSRGVADCFGAAPLTGESFSRRGHDAGGSRSSQTPGYPQRRPGQTQQATSGDATGPASGGGAGSTGGPPVAPENGQPSGRRRERRSRSE